MGAGPDNEPLAPPRNFFLGRKRCVAELFAELLGRSLLPFAHFTAVDHHIMRVAFSLDLDLAKLDQSRFHISMHRLHKQIWNHEKHEIKPVAEEWRWAQVSALE